MRASTAFVALTFTLAARSSNSETHASPDGGPPDSGTSDASHVPKGAGAHMVEGS